MARSFSDMIAAISPDVCLSQIYAFFAKVGVSVTSWKPLSPLRTLLNAQATWNAAFSQWASNAVRLKFLQLSAGDWVDACAQYDYGTFRQTANFANGSVLLSNISSNTYDFDAGDLSATYTAVNPDQSVTKHTYHFPNAVHLDPSSQVSALIEADTIGASETIPAGATLTLTPAYDGVSATVSTAIVGQDDEGDQALINRAQDSTAAKSPGGPREIYSAIALGLTDANGARICTKCEAVPGNPVAVVCSGPGGAIAGDLDDPTTPLGLLNLAIQTECVPLGVPANVEKASPHVINIAYTAYASRKSTLTDAQLLEYIGKSLIKLFSTFPIGGFLIPDELVDDTHPAGTRWIFRDAIKGAIASPLSDVKGVTNPIFDVAVTPLLDVFMQRTEDPVLGIVTGRVVRQ